MLTGSFASNVYGIARSTKDADLVVDFDVASLDDILSHLDSRLQLNPQMMFETITGTLRHVIEVEDNPFQIGLFHVNPDPFMKGRFSRKIEVEYPELERTVWLPTPEDVVVQKLRWGRDKDLSDVEDVLFVSGSGLDFEYIETWCRQHGTIDRLDSVRANLPSEPQ